MRSYELVYIVSPEVEEEQLDTVVERVNQFITNQEGAIVEVSPWGRRKLAYPIKHFSEGSYILTKIELDPEKVKGLEANLYLAEEIIRHLLVRTED